MAALRRWRFQIEALELESGILLDDFGAEAKDEASGEMVLDDFQARLEAERRADLWEQRTGGTVVKVVCASQGRVGAPLGSEQPKNGGIHGS